MITSKNCDDPGLWDEIIHDLGGHPLQLWGWGELKAAHGWAAHRIIVVDADDRVIGAAQILSRRLPGPFRRLSYVPRGPVWHKGMETEVLEALVHYVKQHLPGVVLTIEPDTAQIPHVAGWRRSSNTILIPRTIILDLTKSEETLLDEMATKTRYYIRRSGKQAITLRKVTSDAELDQCLEVYKETAERAGFALHSDQYYRDLHEKLGDNSVIFAAFEDDQPVAFVWLAVSATTAFELYGGMTERGKQIRANFALKWYAIAKCKEWGIDRYDMNGLLNDGVSTFKQGFASHEDMLAGTYDYPLSPLYAAWTKGLPAAKRAVRGVKKLTRQG